MKLSFLGTRHRSNFDDRQSLDIYLVVIFYLVTPQLKTPPGRIRLTKDEGVEFQIQVQFISLLHEPLYLFINSFVLFPSRVKRINFCFVYSENHYPSCIYPSLEEETQQPCIVDVDSISLPQPIPKDEICI